MGLFGQKLSVGVDIGIETIKLVCLSRSRSEYRLVFYGLFKRDDVDGVKRVLEDPRLHKASIRLAMRDNLIKSRQFELPPVPAEELDNMLKLTVGPSLSGSVEDYILRYQPVQKTLFISEKRQVEEYLHEVQVFGILNPDILEPRVNALALAALYNHPSSDLNGQQAVVDIGHGSALFLVASKEGVLFSRNLSDASGQDLLLQIANSCAISEQEAIKRRDADPEFLTLSNPQAKRPIIQWLYKVAVEIQNSIESYQLQFPGKRVTELLITGGASKTSGLASYVSDTLKIPTLPLYAFRQVNTSGFPAFNFEDIGHFYAVAVGLAL